jgi:hypothetical protein
MKLSQLYIIRIFAALLSVSAPELFAQVAGVAPDKTIDSTINAISGKPTKIEHAENLKVDPAKALPDKKMVQDATINLQTTITGNQEQPRVLYILPWQSPQTAKVDFEPLDNEQKSVFNHVEREELRRELESAGELQ